jgi:WhiB family redox-sensing transcriptional regulator
VTTDDRGLACARVGPELFFSDLPEDIQAAKFLCADCPLRTECLAGALDRAEPWGVWGGELLQDGHIITRKRRRGRPRKSEQAA